MSRLVGITLFTDDASPKLTLGPPIGSDVSTPTDIGIKSGEVLAGAFTGDTASVVFSTAYADALYSITFNLEGVDFYTVNFKNKVASGFDIMLSSSDTSGLTKVTWQTVINGS